jgi:FHS family Na+ dependent glucose MFS transporter 1
VIAVDLSAAGSDSARRVRLLQSAGYYLAFVTLGLVGASLGPTLPGLAAQTAASFAAISYLFTARSFGYLAGSFIGGRLYDRIPGHRVMAAVLVIIGILMAFVPGVAWLPLLIVVLLFIGLAEGALDVGGNTLLVWVHGAGVGPFMNALHFFWGFGAFLSPIIVAWAIARSGGIAPAYLGLALLVLPPVVWLLRVCSPDRPWQSAHPEAAGATDAAAPQVAAPLAAAPLAAAPMGLVMIFMTFLFLYVGAEIAFGGWIYSYALTLGLADATMAAYLTSVFWGSLTLGRLLTIPLAARLRPAVLLGLSLSGCLATLLMLLLLRGSSTVVWVGAVTMGLSMAAVFPVTITLAGRLMPITGRITAWFFVGSSAGGMVVPWIIGQWFEAAGAQVTMVIVLVDLLLASGVYLLLLARARARQDELAILEG